MVNTIKNAEHKLYRERLVSCIMNDIGDAYNQRPYTVLTLSDVKDFIVSINLLTEQLCDKSKFSLIMSVNSKIVAIVLFL